MSCRREVRCGGEVRCRREVRCGGDILRFDLENVVISKSDRYNVKFTIKNSGTKTICAKKVVFESEHFGRVSFENIVLDDSLSFDSSLEAVIPVQKNPKDKIRAFMQLDDGWIYSDEFYTTFIPYGIKLQPRLEQSGANGRAVVFNVGDVDVENVKLVVRSGNFTTIQMIDPPTAPYSLAPTELTVIYPILRKGHSEALVVRFVSPAPLPSLDAFMISVEHEGLNYAPSSAYATTWPVT